MKKDFFHTFIQLPRSVGCHSFTLHNNKRMGEHVTGLGQHVYNKSRPFVSFSRGVIYDSGRANLMNQPCPLV